MEEINPVKPPSLERRLLITLGKALLFTVITVLIVIGLSVPIALFIPDEQAAAMAANDLSDIDTWVLNLTYATTIVGALVALLIVRRLIGKQSLATAGLSFRHWARELGEGLLLGAILVLTGFGLMWAFGLAQPVGFDFVLPTFLGWGLLFLLQPFVEELVFRGFLMSLLARYFSVQAALIVSSFAFALVHAFNDGFSIIGFLTILVSGVLLGLLFLRSARLWLPTGLHAAWNFVQGVILGYSTSGVTTYSITEMQTTDPAWLSGGAFGFEGSVLAIAVGLVGIWWYRDSMDKERLTALVRTEESATTL